MTKHLNEDLSDLQFIIQLAQTLDENPDLAETLRYFAGKEFDTENSDQKISKIPLAAELIGIIAVGIAHNPLIKGAVASAVKLALVRADVDRVFSDKVAAMSLSLTTSENTPLWLRSKAELEHYIKERFNEDQRVVDYGPIAEKVEIISGLDADVPCINSLIDFSEDLLDVHLKTDPKFLSLEEKYRRATEAGSCFGWRELFLCLDKPEEMHPSWRSYWQFFSQALVKINDVMYTAVFLPHITGGDLGCSFAFRELSSDSASDGRFPLLKVQ